MKLTFLNRIKICWETLTIRSGHAHTAQEKQLSVFKHGYYAGVEDSDREPLNKGKCNVCAEYDQGPVIEPKITETIKIKIIGRESAQR